MRQKPVLFTRRDFIRSAALASAGATMPLFLAQSVKRVMADDTPGDPLPGFKDDRILVVIQLSGGNDGLNTIIPVENDDYYRVRPRLAIPKDRTLAAGKGLAFHPNLKGLKELFDDGNLAIVNAVGYPNPNRSHFRSMEIWHTASDSAAYETTGWIGRYFDNTCGGQDPGPEPLVGVNIGRARPQAFSGRTAAGVSFQDPRAFRWLEGPAGDDQYAFRTLNHVGDRETTEESTLDFLRHTTSNMVLGSDTVLKASQKKRTKPTYPRGRLAADLERVATLIMAGLPTRIYYVSHGGFDTHAGQNNTHGNLLAQYGSAVNAFHKDLKANGLSDRVLIMTFSEFGRRVAENASNGTDHGTAGPMFLVGDSVHPGLHGDSPSLTDLDRGDLKYSIDFRSVYASVLDDWFDVDSSKILGRSVEKRNLLKGGTTHSRPVKPSGEPKKKSRSRRY